MMTEITLKLYLIVSLKNDLKIGPGPHIWNLYSPQVVPKFFLSLQLLVLFSTSHGHDHPRSHWSIYAPWIPFLAPKSTREEKIVYKNRDSRLEMYEANYLMKLVSCPLSRSKSIWHDGWDICLAEKVLNIKKILPRRMNVIFRRCNVVVCLS